MAQLVEHNLAKVGVAGSSPVVRSIAFPDRLGGPFSAKWPSGKAEACKAFTPGSNPGFASRQHPGAPAPVLFYICGHGSVGRAQPCQGWGREFESRFPLFDRSKVALRFYFAKLPFFLIRLFLLKTYIPILLLY